MKTLPLRRAKNPTRKMIRKQQRLSKKLARSTHSPVAPPVPTNPQPKRKVKQPKPRREPDDPVEEEEFALDPSSFDHLDDEIRVLEKKLGLRKSGKKDESEKKWKKMKRYLELDGLGADFYDKLEGKPDTLPDVEEEAMEVDPLDEEAEMREASELAAEDEHSSDANEEESVVSEERAPSPIPVPKPQPLPDLQSLSKQLNSIFNRLSETNIDPLSRQLVSLFQLHSLTEASSSLSATLISSCLKPAFVPICVMISQTAAIVSLGFQIGKEVVAYILKAVYDLFVAEDTDKECKKHCVDWISYLYLFGGVSGRLISGLLKHLGEELTEDSVELLIEVLGIAGFRLRKDEPEALKSIITDLQSKAKSALTAASKRTQFMLEVLLNVKNNKKKLAKDDHLLFLKTWLKSQRSGGRKETKLNTDWEGLKTQRWRELVSVSSATQKGSARKATAISAPDPQLEALAKANHMNTEARRSVFYTVMSAHDYKDAYVRLATLPHSKSTEREIMRVLLTCCGQEQTYNEYYALLAEECLRHNKKLKYDVQFSLWDVLKAIEEFTPRKVANIAKWTARLLATLVVDLAVLKVIELERMETNMTLYLRLVLEDLFRA